MDSQGTDNHARNLCFELMKKESSEETIGKYSSNRFELIAGNWVIKISDGAASLWQTNDVKDRLFEVRDQKNFSIQGRVFYYSNISGELLVQVPFNSNSRDSSYAPTALHGRNTNSVRVEVCFDVMEGLGVSLPVDYGKPNVYTDVCVLVGEQKFYVPKAVLAMKSKYFENLLLNSTVKDGCHEINLENVSVRGFTAILDLLFGTFYCVFNGPEEHMAFYEEIFALIERFGMQFLNGRVIEHIIKDKFRFWDFERLHQLLLADKCKIAPLWHYLMEVWTRSDTDGMSQEMFSRLSPAAAFEMLKKRDSCRDY